MDITRQQQYWSSGTEAQPVALNFHNEGEFYAACRQRYENEHAGAASLHWQGIAERFPGAMDEG